MKKWLFLFPLALFAANSSSQTLFYRLDPTSIPQHRAFTELYGDTVEGRKAQKQLFSLLKGDMQLTSFTHLQAALDLFSRQKRSDTLLPPQEIQTISALSAHLENRKLKGYKADEVDSLEPHEIDLGRALLLTTNPEMMDSYEAMLDLMALQVLARDPQTPEEKVHAINQLIFHELRLRFPQRPVPDFQIPFVLLDLQVGAHPGFDLHYLKRFSDVVHRTRLEPFGLVFDLTQGSDEDDRNTRRAFVGLQPDAHLVPVHLRHHDVEQDQVGSVLLYVFQRPGSTGGHA